MDIEQLRLILDTLRDAGQGAWWIALLWVAKPYFAITVWASVLVTVVVVVTRAVTRSLFIEEVKAAAGIRGELYESSREIILNLIDRGKEATNKR
jgi:hypothetical protein